MFDAVGASIDRRWAAIADRGAERSCRTKGKNKSRRRNNGCRRSLFDRERILLDRPAKKQTVIGQQSMSLPFAENACELSFLPSNPQFPVSLLSGQWSAEACGFSIDRQYATQAAPAPFRQMNTVTKRARARILIDGRCTKNRRDYSAEI
jgi:hypothetical protein